MGDKRKKIAECVQVLVEVIRMFSAAPSSAREGSSQHPILSHTLAQNVQQTLDT
jgi:hypothetical protein